MFLVFIDYVVCVY